MPVLNRRSPYRNWRQDQSFGRSFTVNRDTWQYDGLTFWLPALSNYGVRDRVLSRAGAPTAGVALLSDEMGLVWNFRANDEIEFTSPNLPTGISPWTTSVWFNTDDTGTTAADVWQNVLFYWGVHSGAGESVRLAANEDAIRFERFGGAVTWNTPSPQNGAWHLFTITYDGVTARIYYDGLQKTTHAYAANVLDGSLFVGSGDGQRYYDGLAGDSRIITRALSAAEVFALWAPSTRWDLYKPPARAFFMGPLGAAPAIFPILTTGGGYSLPVG